MIVNTTRFGPIEISKEDILNFSEGLLGFNDLEKFVLLDDPNDEIFAWLQSCDEARQSGTFAIIACDKKQSASTC